MLSPARGWRIEGSMEGVRKEETSEEVVGSKACWVKEVVGAMSPESGGGAEAGAGLRPVMASQMEDICEYFVNNGRLI